MLVFAYEVLLRKPHDVFTTFVYVALKCLKTPVWNSHFFLYMMGYDPTIPFRDRKTEIYYYAIIIPYPFVHCASAKSSRRWVK